MMVICRLEVGMHMQVPVRGRLDTSVDRESYLQNGFLNRSDQQLVAALVQV
jgi:hypothetical protein